MIVVVAEKPSVGRDIARVLKCTERHEGYLSNDRYTVTWALGHLVALQEPDEIDPRYKKWSAGDLPILPDEIPTKVLSKTKKQYKVVRDLINAGDTEQVICATDAGREGELIFRFIYDSAGCKKDVKRLWISSMTDAAIREGFESLRPGSDYRGLYNSAICRARADWYVGMNASRAFTIRYKALLSVGRVQTPTLAILVSRAREIRDFVSRPYYTVTADFGSYKGTWFDPQVKEEKESVRIGDEEKAARIADAVARQEGVIKSVLREDKRELPPLLYDLTSLQRDANARYGFTADKTLKIAQSLYEKWKAVTYPRTDSRYLTEDMYPKLMPVFKKLPEQFRAHVEGIPLKDGKLPFSRRIFDAKKVSDHHAIIPTLQSVSADKLPPDEMKLYEMIALRTIAAFYPAFEYVFQKAVTDVGGELFRSTGRLVTGQGWKAVVPEQAKTGKKANAPDEDQPLPDLKEGDRYTVRSAKVKKDATKPPAPHTDASLLAAMENAGKQLDDEALREQMKGSGLGTPATRAAMIERLIKVGYARRMGRTIQATDKGEALIRVVPGGLSSPEMTGRWELKLDQIAKGGGDTDAFMDDIKKYSAQLVSFALHEAGDETIPDTARTRAGKKKTVDTAPKEPLGVCPLCGGNVLENSKAFGCGRWKEGCRFTLWKNALVRGKGPELTGRIVKMLLSSGSVKGSTGVIALKDGRMTFTPSGADQPSVDVGIEYIKNAR